MKTTIEISDALGQKARALAKARDTTLRALVERGLHLVLVESEAAPTTFEPVLFDGCGLSPEFEGRGWEALAEAAYEGRGG